MGTTIKTFSIRSATFRSCTETIVLLLSLSFQARAITLDFQNLDATVVDFPGNSTFSFTSTNGYQFSISSVEGGVGDSVGLNGYVHADNPFTIGAITITPFPGGLEEESAPVTGTGTLHITDALATDLTSTIQWVDIETFGVAGVLDLTGTLNLTGINYSGANSDLCALAADGSAVDVVTFQFVPAESLTELANTGGQTSYSGSITSVPEPGTWVLVAIGTGLAVFLRGRKQVRR
jgi:hypothetical protein